MDAAEPFIGHFLWEYACHFPNRDRAFQSITGRIPFYLGMTLLRIARNQWIDPDYRHRLIHEAAACLRALQMQVKGIFFDINGTLTDIHTNEGHDEIYRILSNVLSYQGIVLEPHVVQDLSFQTMKEQRAAHEGRHPEFDAVGIFHTILTQYATDFTRGLSPQSLFMIF